MIRIQRRRVKGWKAPESTYHVTRPSKYGNLFIVGEITRVYNGNVYLQYGHRELIVPETPVQAVEAFKRYQLPYMDLQPLYDYEHISCWCPVGSPCHGDAIVEAIRAKFALQSALNEK